MRIALLSIIVGLSVTLASDRARLDPDAETFDSTEAWGAADFIAGWQALGTCTSANNISGTNRDSVQAQLDVLRRHGLNTVRETASADGRIVARGVSREWYNWYGYTFSDADGEERRRGHPRPGVFVEGMRWMLDAAYGDAEDSQISVIVGLPGFVTPSYRGEPYSGSDVISCAAYQDFIDTEISANPTSIRAGIPPVRCASGERARPFWEWNIWYVVTNLSDHPGLRAWYLWDEPEGISHRHLFGSTPGVPRKFEGPGSLPTTDLLRYVYRLVHEFDERDHPAIVDIHSPHVFFSDRFDWSVQLDPAWSSGPFDISPSGEYDTPADILGLEASSYMANTRPAEDLERIKWFSDPNVISRTSAMLADAAKRDGKKAMVVAAQAQLPSRGPFAVREPLRCGPNDEARSRLLNDRDLIWELLTTQVNGLYGYIYYSQAMMPYRGPGAEQIKRSNRLLEQFMDAGLDRVFAAPEENGRVGAGSVHIVALTDYYRNPPNFVGPAQGRIAGISKLSTSMTTSRSRYTAGVFNRSDTERNYGDAEVDEKSYVLNPGHELLRVSLRSWGGAEYLIVSNAYDARISAEMTYASEMTSVRVSEGRFDLNRGEFFRWATPTDLTWTRTGDTFAFEIGLEPYEARIFRIK